MNKYVKKEITFELGKYLYDILTDNAQCDIMDIYTDANVKSFKTSIIEGKKTIITLQLDNHIYYIEIKERIL